MISLWIHGSMKHKSHPMTRKYQTHEKQLKTKNFEKITIILENLKRFMINPKRKDYETIFPSGYHRSIILNDLKKQDLVETNFIQRKRYRAGATTQFDRNKTTLEYYNNIREADYVICLWDESVLKGGGSHGEITLAYYNHKPIFLVNQLPLSDLSGWIMSCATEIVTDFDRLKKILLQ